MAERKKRKPYSKPAFDTRDLIRLVQEQRCLWDRTCPEYRDRSQKEKAWGEIYKEIEPSYDSVSEEMKNFIGSQITRKWYNIRDSYVKSKKLSARNKPYVYARLLTFLDTINLDDSECEDSRHGDRNFDSLEDHWLNDVLVVDDDISEPDSKKAKEDKIIESEDSIVNMLANLIQREEDDDRAFFKSITPMVKSLSEDAKFEFRIQVMHLLKTLKGKDRQLCVKQEIDDDSDE